MRIIELIEDRKGKLSTYKLTFIVGSFIFLIGWAVSAIWNKTVPEIPSGIPLFLGVIGGTGLGKSYIQNKAPTATDNVNTKS